MSLVKCKTVRMNTYLTPPKFFVGFVADFSEIKPSQPEFVTEFNDYITYYFKDSINAPDFEVIRTAKDSIVELINKVIKQ
jgi:hypothetical protein